MPTALVTGATAGLGAEFARQLAAQRYDLVLVARDQARLDAAAAELTARFGIRVELLATDLSDRDGLARVEARAGDPGQAIDLLVNNAGSGQPDPFEDNPIEVEQAALDLLVTAPMRLMHAALQQMLPRGSGVILNVASVAGFTPRGSYGAAKAWLLSFSRWANLHYRPRGITVTALAPGLVRTEFHQRMGVRTDTLPRFAWLDAERVVRIALRHAARGRAVSVPTLRYKLAVALARALPDRFSAAGTLHRLR